MVIDLPRVAPHFAQMINIYLTGKSNITVAKPQMSYLARPSGLLVLFSCLPLSMIGLSQGDIREHSGLGAAGAVAS